MANEFKVKNGLISYGNIVPSGSYAIGTASNPWQDSHFNGNIYMNTVPLSTSLDGLSGSFSNNNLQLSSIASVSGNWDSVYSNVNSNSGTWDNADDVSYVSGKVSNNISSISDISSVSGNWDSVYSNVNSSSGDWESVYSYVNSSSGDWESTYSTVSSNSGTWSGSRETAIYSFSDYTTGAISDTDLHTDTLDFTTITEHFDNIGISITDAGGQTEAVVPAGTYVISLEAYMYTATQNANTMYFTLFDGADQFLRIGLASSEHAGNGTGRSIVKTFASEATLTFIFQYKGAASGATFYLNSPILKFEKIA